MVNVRVPPYTGNEELDVYLRDLTDLLEEFNLTAVTAGVTTSNALEENLSSGTIEVGGDVYGYRYNNLAIRYSTSSNGAENFSDSIAVLPPTTTTFYVGLRSTPDAVESNNPADYTWVQASPTWNINLRLYYRVTGGKQFDYIIAATNPNPQAYAEDTGEFVNLSLVTAVEMIELVGGRGADGRDGTDGRSTANLSIYLRATSAPATPTGGSYDFSANTITAPTDWSASIPSGSDDLYISQAIASIEGNDGTDNDLTWSAPVLFVESVINGADGFSLFEASIYRRATATPATPTGGSYNFGTNTLTAPTDWSDDIPDGSNPVYRSTGLFEVQGNTGTDSSVTWTAPKLFVQDGGQGDAGTDGTSTYRAIIYNQTSTEPDTPTGGSFNFTTNVLTAPVGWTETFPDITDTPTYRSTGLFSISGDEGTDNTVTWSSPAISAQKGDQGDPGTDATRSATGIVYYTLASTNTPTTPSATSYNFSTGTFTGLSSNWQTTPVQVNITDTITRYWQSRYLITEATFGGEQTLTFTTPSGSINFGDDIQSDNFVANSTGWQIQRDTGNAEFSNVIVRGDSTVNTATIGGDAFITNTLFDEDDELNGQIPSSILSGAGNNNVTSAFWRVDSIHEDQDSVVFADVSITFWGRLTNGNDGTAKSDFDNEDVTLTLTFQFKDDDDSDVGSSFTRTTFIDYDDFSTSSSGASLFYSIFDIRSQFDDLFSDITSIPNGSTRLEVSVAANTNNANWGLSSFPATSYIIGGLVSKPSSGVSGYASASVYDDIALQVSGGLGLYAEPHLIFDGEAGPSVLITADAENVDNGSNNPMMLLAEVTWTDSQSDSSFAVEQAIVPLFVLDTPSQSETIVPLSSSSPIFGDDNRYVGYVRYNGNVSGDLSTIRLDTLNGSDDFSNEQITRVWVKMR